MARSEHAGLSRRSFLTAALALGAAAAGGLSLVSPALAKASGYQETRLAMGTFVRIDVARCDPAKAQDAVQAAFASAARLEHIFTRFESSSALSILNAQGYLADVPQELSLLLNRSREIHSLTEGSFDPSILPLLAALQESRARGERLSGAEMTHLLEQVDFARVRTEGGVRLGDGMSLTLDGIAKGYIAQEMSKALSAAGCPDHLVNAGGDIHASGSPEGQRGWNIAIQSPFSQSRARGMVTISRGALATSGVYEQTLDQASMSHLVIPRTLNRPDVVSASVIARDGALADALATAFSVQAPAQSLAMCRLLDGVETMLVLRNGRIAKSAGWPA